MFSSGSTVVPRLALDSSDDMEIRGVWKEEGWLPQHLVARDASNEILGVVPLYLKR